MNIKGELEIDTERGVIYFHVTRTGHTALRICRLKIPEGFDPGMDMIDITKPEMISYGIWGGKP